MALGLTLYLTVMSTKNISCGDKDGRCVWLTILPASNPRGFSIGRHVFFSRNLSGLSDGAVISLTLVTIDVDYFNYAVDTYRLLHMDAPLKIYPLNFSARVGLVLSEF